MKILGVGLILLGLACFAVLIWASAPMEEPASPGRTPNPSKLGSDEGFERMQRRWTGLARFCKYGAIPLGVALLAAGIYFLIPDRLSRA